MIVELSINTHNNMYSNAENIKLNPFRIKHMMPIFLDSSLEFTYTYLRLFVAAGVAVE